MSEGLFNLAEEAGIEEKAEANVAQQTNMAAAEHSDGEVPAQYYWNENMAGDGDRPDWMPSKFKTVEDQAKAFVELEKKFGGFTGSPESYDLSTSLEKYNMELDKESEVAKNLAGIFSQYNASQEFADAIMDLYAQEKSATQVTQEDVLTSLGEEGKRMVKTISNYAVENLSENEVNILESMMSNAEQVSLVNKLFVNLFGDPQVASPQQVNTYTPNRTTKDIMREIVELSKSGTYDAEHSKKLKDELSRLKTD